MCGPVIVAVLLAIDGLAFHSNYLAPVAGLLATGCMAESRSFALPRVVTTPVKECCPQPKAPFGV